MMEDVQKSCRTLMIDRYGDGALLPEGAPQQDIFYELAVLLAAAAALTQQCAARAKLMRGTIADDRKKRAVCDIAGNVSALIESELGPLVQDAVGQADDMRANFPHLGKRNY